MNLLRRLTYLRGVQAFARKLHLSSVLRRSYYWWVTSGGVYDLHAAGLNYKIRLRAENVRNFEWDFQHSRELGFLEALKTHLHPGDTALDVGADYGQFTVPLGQIVGPHGRVLSFEPRNSDYQLLLTNVKLNGLDNVEAYKMALGESDTPGQIFVGGGGASIIPPDEDTMRCSASESIAIARGDTFFSRRGLPIPQAVKIDVEGYEYAVLNGLRGTVANPKCRLICVEVHPRLLPSAINLATISEFLQSAGFQDLRRITGEEKSTSWR